jgi:hypothetical protein
MNYKLTIFKSQFDNKTHRTMSLNTWDKFVDLLEGLSKTKGEKGGRNSSPLITPAVFETDSTRSNKSTLYWGGWCAVDVDDHNFTNDILSLKEQLIDRFRDLDFVCYSTASSRDAHLKFRLVFRLDETVETDRIKPFWFAFNNAIGELGDPQTKDLARMYYIPAIYPNANNFFFSHMGGNPVNVSEVIAKYPYVEKTGNSFLDRLPPEMQKAVVEHRKNSLNNTNFNWTSYRDCPFWPKRLGIEYQTITGTGWYLKMYQIMVAVAGSAVSRGYPISSSQIAGLCKEFDSETGNWYENRPLNVEADRALEYVYRNG